MAPMRGGMKIPVWATLATALCCTGARAEECGPLNLLNAIQMAPFGNPGVMVVPDTINGTPKGLILDTGASETQIARVTAEDLQLPLHRRRTLSLDVNGNTSRGAALVGKLRFGNAQRKDIVLRVWPDPDFARALPLVAGVMSRDLLFDYDADVDFGTGLLKLFSKDHCFGKIDYWHPPAMAAMRITIRDGHVHVPVTLDGHAFDAVIDTGSQHSTISLPVARRMFGLSPGSPGVASLGPVNNDPALTGFVHTFGSLSFGSVMVLTPDMMILPDKVSRDGYMGWRTPDRAFLQDARRGLPEVMIGMDVLRHLHIYLAPDECNFYVSLASSTDTPAAAKP
jgi:hypothetical protein